MLRWLKRIFGPKAYFVVLETPRPCETFPFYGQAILFAKAQREQDRYWLPPDDACDKWRSTLDYEVKSRERIRHQHAEALESLDRDLAALRKMQKWSVAWGRKE